MSKYPFLTLPQWLTALRLSTAFIFIAHALVRLLNGTIPRFAGYLESEGLPFGLALVWSITVFEIAGGLLLAFGWYTRALTAGFIFLLLMGIVLIHARLGWFVGEHGSGGSEYSFILIVALLVIAAGAKSKRM